MKMDGELLSLKWNNHRTTFLQIIGNLRNKASYTDATLACDGKFYPVHRLVLSTCSEYFSAIFDNTPCKNPVVVLKDIECKNLEFLLDYMYIGEVNVRQTELAALIKAAECLRIKGLAVPDEDPVKSHSKCKSSSSRDSSPPSKRRRHSAFHSEENRNTNRESTNSNVREKARRSSPPPNDDPNIIHVKEEPVESEEPNISEFGGECLGISEGGDMEDSIDPGDIDNDGASDLQEFFQNTVEKEEPVHMSDYSPTEFPGPSGLQNSSMPSSWENESFQSDSLTGAAEVPPGGTQPQDQQQQQMQPSRNADITHRGKKSSNLSNIYYDRDIIEGKTFFLCPYCNYKTTYKSHLDRHCMSHFGERPYKCDLCPYRSIQKGHIQRHMSSVHYSK